MSSVSSRSKANNVESVAVPVGAIIVSACLIGLAKGLNAVAKSAFDSTRRYISSGEAPCLKSVSQIRADAKQLKFETSPNHNLEAIKGQILGQIASQPYLVSEVKKLENGVKAITEARTVAEMESAKLRLISTLEDNTQQIFTDVLIGACHRAALKIGFTKIEAFPSRLPYVVRLAATDEKGRTLITEVTAPKDRDVRVETEVVGVSDGSCNGILDAFDKALEEEGVRSQSPKRKYTGGVCETAAVRDFLAKKVKTRAKKVEVDNFASTDDVKRTRRLNNKAQIQKQK